MRRPRWIPPLFYVAALYDGLLGLLFLLIPGYAFDVCKVTPPNHDGYVQFPAALLLVFSLMFLAIARNPAGNRHLIVYGILLKLAYCGVACWHWFTADIPFMWKPFAVIDLVMAILFVWAYAELGRGLRAEPDPDHQGRSPRRQR
jgi:hypothetical protein